ncbi:MAG: hypothetical protein ACI8U3_001202 [Brevundimonas sp.]|jgi:hypothetical protein
MLTVVFAAAAALTTHAAHSASQESVAVLVERSPDGVSVQYSLPAPVHAFAFADEDVIRDRWQIVTEGLTLDGAMVTGAERFSTFEVRITPDAAEVDRIYMGLSRAGEGYVLYGPALKAEGYSTSLRFDDASDDVAVPAVDAVDGYVFFGPADHVTDDAHGAFIADPELSAELAAPIRDAFRSSMEFYQARLNLDLDYHPAVIASVDSPGPAIFRGDVTDTGVISVRFTGDSWRGAEAFLAPFVWHETFHLWNGHGIQNRDGESAPWLHEGAAEYASIIGAVSANARPEDQGRSALAQKTNGCRRALASREGGMSSVRSGSSVYDCGALIQWIADLELQNAGQGAFFSLWADILRDARASDDGYGVTEFMTALPASSAVRLLVEEEGEIQWDQIRARMTDLGVTFVNDPGAGDLLTAALFHIARQNCSNGSYGFYNDPGALRLDGADCGPLSGEPIIDTVEGFDPQQQSAAMFNAVQARCAASLPIRYQARDGRVLEAVCDSPLETPEVWAISEAPSLRR